MAPSEATEQETWGDPQFRVRGKILVMHKQGDPKTGWTPGRGLPPVSAMI